MVKRADRAQEPRNFSGGTRYDPLPPCADCAFPSLIRLQRNGGWENLCAACYARWFNGGKPVPKINEWPGPTAYGSRISKEILRKLKSFVRHRPSRDWAPRLLERYAAGEKISSYAVECALEVVGAKRLAEREPGEDDA